VKKKIRKKLSESGYDEKTIENILILYGVNSPSKWKKPPEA
jgi:hypothetical protein